MHIPDFRINTEGVGANKAVEIARDAIGIVGINMEDENEKLPEPTLHPDVLRTRVFFRYP